MLKPAPLVHSFRAYVVAVCLAGGALPALADTPAAPAAGGDNASGQQTVQLGSLKFTFGPQSSGDFGAALKGGVTNQLKQLHDSGCFAKGPAQDRSCSDWFAVLETDADGAWSSAAKGTQNQNKNNITLSAKPSIYYEYSREYDPVNKPEYERRRTACQQAINAARQAGQDVPQVEQHNADCLYAAIIKPEYTRYFVAGIYPDLEYRYGYFQQSGTTYSANQLVTGAGVQLFYPARIGGFFANWPYLSASYTGVKNHGASDLPVASGIKNHFLELNQRLEFYIPGFKNFTGVEGLILIDVTESRPMGGGNGSSAWQTARMLQLIVGSVGSTGLKPALTLRSGQNKGLTYDRQIIFGVLWDIFDKGKSTQR